MRATHPSPAPIRARRRFGGLDRILRTVIAAMVATITLVLDLISFSQLIFSGPLAPSRTAGFAAMLLSSVVGSLAFAAVRRGVPVTLTFIGAAVIVQASIAASVAERLAAAGITDPDTLVTNVLLASGAATLTTGIAFVLLGKLRASLLAQLLPFPVLAGFLAGVGLLFVKGGVQIGARLADPIPDLLAAPGPAVLARLALTLSVGACAFYLPRRLRHWSVFPAIILGTFVIVHAALWWEGVDTGAAQAAGWLLDPIPSGSLLRLPIVRNIGAFDASLLLPLVPKIVTLSVVAVIIQILYVLSNELELKRDLDIDQLFLACGSANVFGSLCGSPAIGMSRTSTAFLHNLGGGNWLGWSLTVAVMLALLVFGAGALSLMPRPLAGGALVAIGLGLLAGQAATLRTISLWETAIALTVCLATAWLGAATGFIVGIALAILIFAVQYARIPAVRLALTGAERRSSVIRAPEATRALREAGGHTIVYALQGYLFFLNAQAIYRRVGTEGGVRTLILDFHDCVGLDSSALLAFRKIAQLADQRGFDLLLAYLDPAARRQVERSGLAGQPRVRVLDTLDRALQLAESTLLDEAGIRLRREDVPFWEEIGRTLGRDVSATALEPYLTRKVFEPGEVLLRQGDTAGALYFVEEGVVSIELELPGKQNLPLRTTRAGTIIGEIAMLLGNRRTATAIALSTCRTVELDRSALDRMERDDPKLALIVQRYLTFEIADKTVNMTQLMEAQMR